MFNKEQTEHMQGLAAIPSENRCWCGWDKLGECRNCPEKSHSLAARIKVSCPHRQCRSYPRPDDPEQKITHTVACPVRLEKEMELMSSDDWSKLLTLAEYGAWRKVFPKIVDMFADDPGMEPVEVTVKGIIDGLPQDLQELGMFLAFNYSHDYCLRAHTKALGELFRRKVLPPKPHTPSATPARSSSST